MTRPRYDDKGTEFGLWLRKQREIESHLGFTTTNIDYFWWNYKTNDFMLLEEKRHLGKLRYTQKEAFRKIHNILLRTPGYRGFFLIKFQNTSPDDGDIYISGKDKNDVIQKERKITKDELLEFLRFQKE